MLMGGWVLGGCYCCCCTPQWQHVFAHVCVCFPSALFCAITPGALPDSLEVFRSTPPARVAEHVFALLSSFNSLAFVMTNLLMGRHLEPAIKSAHLLVKYSSTSLTAIVGACFRRVLEALVWQMGDEHLGPSLVSRVLSAPSLSPPPLLPSFPPLTCTRIAWTCTVIYR